MTNKAICPHGYGPIKPGTKVTYETYESYNNEWITVYFDGALKNMDMETFENNFEKI